MTQKGVATEQPTELTGLLDGNRYTVQNRDLRSRVLLQSEQPDGTTVTRDTASLAAGPGQGFLVDKRAGMAVWLWADEGECNYTWVEAPR